VTHTPTVKASNDHHALLLVLIDHFSLKTPQVDGVWLVIEDASISHLILLPIYPSSSTEKGLSYPYIDHFSLDGSGAPSPAFLEGLAASSLSWEDYLVLDRMGLAGLAGQTSASGQTRVAPDRFQLMPDPPSPRNDPRAALLFQVSLFHAMCSGMAELTAPDKAAATLINRISQHYSSSLSAEAIATGLDGLLVKGRSLFCEFPSSALAFTTP
jgi:hypothetical protein